EPEPAEDQQYAGARQAAERRHRRHDQRDQLEDGVARRQRHRDEQEPPGVAVDPCDERRGGKHERYPAEIDRHGHAVELAGHTGADRSRRDPEREVEGDEERVLERRGAIVVRPHWQKEREPGAGDQIPVERRQMQLHSAREIAAMRASSILLAVSCGEPALAAIAPASTPLAATSALSRREVSMMGASRRATASRSWKRSGRRNASV